MEKYVKYWLTNVLVSSSLIKKSDSFRDDLSKTAARLSLKRFLLKTLIKVSFPQLGIILLHKPSLVACLFQHGINVVYYRKFYFTEAGSTLSDGRRLYSGSQN